ncbi:hypothetical protein GCM10018987_49770 [Streptomyces cremeus]
MRGGVVGELGGGAGERDAAGAHGVGPLGGVSGLDDGAQRGAQPPGAHPVVQGEREQDQQQRRDDGGLPGQQDGRTGEGCVGSGGHAGGAGTVEPVGDALGDTAGHDAAERAGQHGDGGSAESAHGGAGDGRAAVEKHGGHGQREDQQQLGEGEQAERPGPAVEPAHRTPRRPGPARVQDGEDQPDERAGREQADQGAVQDGVEAGLGAAAPAHHPDHDGRTGQECSLEGPAAHVQDGAVRRAVVAGGGGGEGRGHDEESGGGVCGAQPGDEAAPVPEAGAAECGPGRVLLGARQRLLGLVGAPGAVREVPEQPGEGGGDERRQRDPAARLAPPAAVRGGQEAQPGLLAGAGRGARALPGGEVEGHLAGRGDEQEGEGEGDEAHQDAVEADGAGAPPGGGAHPVREVDDHEGQQEEPQRPDAVARGEVGPDVRLGDRLVPVVPGAVLGVDVLGAAEHGGGGVAGDAGGARVAEHLLGGGPADAVHQEFQGGGVGVGLGVGVGGFGDTGPGGVGRGAAGLRRGGRPGRRGQRALRDSLSCVCEGALVRIWGARVRVRGRRMRHTGPWAGGSPYPCCTRPPYPATPARTRGFQHPGRVSRRPPPPRFLRTSPPAVARPGALHTGRGGVLAPRARMNSS